VTKKFLEAVTEYQEIQIKYKTKFRDRIERQLRIVKPNATTEEIEHLIESGGESELFAQQILAGPQLAEARRALNDIQDRHQDIIKIEKSILVRND
jgi:t-SNARE complex subunit (syntaxin)